MAEPMSTPTAPTITRLFATRSEAPTSPTGKPWCTRRACVRRGRASACCGVQDGLQRGFRALLRKHFAVLTEGCDEVSVLGGTARQQRLDPECFARIARYQQPTGGFVEARLGHFEGLAVVILALQYAAPGSEDERRDAMVCTALEYLLEVVVKNTVTFDALSDAIRVS